MEHYSSVRRILLHGDIKYLLGIYNTYEHTLTLS